MPLVVLLLFFCGGALLLYFPVIDRSFAADDFLVMKRVGLDKVIWIKGFFRPLSDITLYFNYLIGGFRPAGYYLLNILLHGVSTWLFFLFCKKWRWTEDAHKQGKYALIAALLFLCYPFHNETIVWTLGRASLAANLFGIAALLAVVSGLPLGRRIFLCCLCYFIGMAGYESVFLLPLMVLIILFRSGIPRRDMVSWGMALGGTLAVHLVLRVVISGSIAGEYGGAFFGSRLLLYGGNLFRLAGRLFLPPMESVRVMAICFVLIYGGLGFVLVTFWRRYRDRPLVRGYFVRWLLLLAVAGAVPLLSGVSSHTSESDRFLYFPSFFLCGGGTFLLVSLVQEKAVRAGWILGILVYQLIFLELNNRNWIKASLITREVLGKVMGQEAGKKVFVVNLPDEENGAFIFRLGLPDALLMNGRDTSKLVIVSHLPRDKALTLPDTVGVTPAEAGVIRIAPDVTVRRRGVDSFEISGPGDPETRAVNGREGVQTWLGSKNDVILYWNKQQLVPLGPEK
jgi:hypothetical protein